MLLLLPPSEGKAVPQTGEPVDLAALTFPELARPRRELMRDLARLCRGDLAAALDALGLRPGQAGEISANRVLAKAPTLPAAELYTGVLHSALSPTTLPAPARRRLSSQVLVFSGLWGAVGYADRLPRYKLPIGARIGTPLAARWRGVLAAPLAERAGDGLVVDLRSAPYAAAWRPTGDLAQRTVVVSVLAERRVDGRVVVVPVSHFNKAAKGRFARELLQRPTDDPRALLDRAASAGLRGELAAAGHGLRLDLVEPVAAT